MNIPHYIHISEGCFLEDILQGPEQLDHSEAPQLLCALQSRCPTPGAWRCLEFTEFY